jgi:putative hydrolase
MSAALSEQLTQNLPPELAGVLGNAGDLMKSVGGTLFAIQLGQALGKLSGEVLSGGDIGLPLFKDQRAAFVPQNLQEFVEGLGEETDQAYIYLAIREMAHVRLFKHSKWLRDHIVSQITTYASEISIDSDRISELAESLDPNDTDAIKQAIESGAFISERTDEQNQALASIENMLALIEGWVDVVTEDATRLLPRSGAIAESVRRRRATAGPAELTFGTLIGLELRPRRLREATAMWRAVTDAVGIDRRDSLWDHPDLAPTGEDINNPAALIEKLQGKSPEADDFDRALRDLLGD